MTRSATGTIVLASEPVKSRFRVSSGKAVLGTKGAEKPATILSEALLEVSRELALLRQVCVIPYTFSAAGCIDGSC